MITEWDILEELDGEEVIEGYLDEAKSVGDESLYQECLADVEVARALLTISKAADIDLESLRRIYSSEPVIIISLAEFFRKMQDSRRRLQQVRLEVMFAEEKKRSTATGGNGPFFFSPVLAVLLR